MAGTCRLALMTYADLDGSIEDPGSVSCWRIVLEGAVQLVKTCSLGSAHSGGVQIMKLCMLLTLLPATPI